MHVKLMILTLRFYHGGKIKQKGITFFKRWLNMCLLYLFSSLLLTAFSTGGRILDDFRTSLTAKMAEALTCAQDWLRISRTPLAIEKILLALKEMEEG